MSDPLVQAMFSILALLAILATAIALSYRQEAQELRALTEELLRLLRPKEDP